MCYARTHRVWLICPKVGRRWDGPAGFIESYKFCQFLRIRRSLYCDERLEISWQNGLRYLNKNVGRLTRWRLFLVLPEQQSR
jgi:hypothetical protein